MRAGEEEITNWFSDYSHDIYLFLIYFTGSTDVDDLVQEVFVKAWKSYHTFNQDSNPKSWLLRIARNAAIDEARNKKQQAKKITKAKLHCQAYEKSAEDIFALNEENRELYRTIKTLKNNYQAVLILKGIKQFNVKETAEILNWKENRVRVTYHRAVKALEKGIESLSSEK